MLYIGTTGKQTKEEERDRLLGLVKVDSTHVFTQNLVEPQKWASHLADNDGQPKWPYGLPITEAWEFVDSPLPEEKAVLPRLRNDHLDMKMAVNYEQLTPEEQERVLALPRNRVAKIYSSAEIETARARQTLRANLRAGGSSPGPTPITGSRTVGWKVQPAKFYCMELEGGLAFEVAGISRSVKETRRIYKLGWAIDPDLRRRALNFSMPNMNSLGWKVVFTQAAATQLDAYKIEQVVLAKLKSKKLVGKEEMVCCTLTEVHLAAISAFSSLPTSNENEMRSFIEGLDLQQMAEL